ESQGAARSVPVEHRRRVEAATALLGMCEGNAALTVFEDAVANLYPHAAARGDEAYVDGGLQIVGVPHRELLDAVIEPDFNGVSAWDVEGVDDRLGSRIGVDESPHQVAIGDAIMVVVARVPDPIAVEVDIPVLPDEAHSGLKHETSPVGPVLVVRVRRRQCVGP